MEEDKNALAFTSDYPSGSLSNKSNNVDTTSISALTEDTDSVFDAGSIHASNSGSSISSASSSAFYTPSAQDTSAINFLHALFPHLSLDFLKLYICSNNNNGQELDMGRITEGLLTEDYLRELEERSIEVDSGINEEEDWSSIVARNPGRKNSKNSKTDSQNRVNGINNSKNNSRSATSPTKRKNKAKGKTLALNDIRQQHQKRVQPSVSHAAGDPWNQIASISSYLSDLLCPPGAQTSLSKSELTASFQSHLHNPKYNSPSNALRSALDTISSDSLFELDDTVFINLVDIVQVDPEFKYDTLSDDSRYQLYSDLHQALRALCTLQSGSLENGSPESALEIVRFFFNMDCDGEHGRVMGLYHTSSPKSPLFGPQTPSMDVLSSPLSSPLLSPTIPSSSIPRTRPPPAPSEDGKSTLYLGSLSSEIEGWQEVPARPKAPLVHPLAAHIPAYDPLNVPRKVKAKIKKQEEDEASPASPTFSPTRPSIKPTVNSFRRMSLNDRSVSVLGRDYKTRIDACRERQAEALRAASRHWRGGSGLSGRGGAKGRGGEVALFYAMEAQRHAAEAKALQMDAVRGLVEKKRWVFRLNLLGNRVFKDIYITLFFCE